MNYAVIWTDTSGGFSYQRVEWADNLTQVKTLVDNHIHGTSPVYVTKLWAEVTATPNWKYDEKRIP